MSDIISYVSNHWVEIAAIFSAVVVAADKIAQLTPTDADNKVVAVLGNLLNLLALNKKQ